MKGYDVIEALGQVEDAYVEEAGQSGTVRTARSKIPWIAAACLLLLLVPPVTGLASDFFSTLKGDELAFGRVEYQGDGIVSIQVQNRSDKVLQFQEDVQLSIFYANREIPQTGGIVRMEGNVVAPHSESELLVDLSDAYDLAITEEPLTDDWYYLVLTNDHYIFGQDWQCMVDFQKPVEETVVYRAEQPDIPHDYPEIVEEDFVYESWAAPVENMKISAFFAPRDNVNRHFCDHINIDGEKGESVFAVENGTVLETGYKAANGNYIILELQENIQVQYGHLQDVYVTAGQKVERGEAIGTLGQTGMATGPNLALTLYVDGEAVNPLREEVVD